MYYEKFFPFLDRGMMVREREESVKIDEVFCPLVGVDTIGKDEAKKELGDRKLRIWRVEPLGVKVFSESDRISMLSRVAYAGMQVDCIVTSIDYGNVAKDIEVSDDGKAYIRFGKDSFSEIEGVIIDDFINAASNGVRLEVGEVMGEVDLSVGYEEEVSIMDLLEEYNAMEGIDEAIPDGVAGAMDKAKDKQGNIVTRSGSVENRTDFVYEHIRSYLETPSDRDSMVPLLLGPTGVFKSATVKNIAEELNMRLMDFRVAFTSRLDYTGLFERYFDSEDGETYSFSCPMEELVVCCDGFLAYCRRALERLDEVIASGTMMVKRGSSGEVTEEEVPIEGEKLEDIIKLREYYFEMAKTPILFFDEITRCEDEGVMGVLTTLLNQKRFGDLTFTECKFIAASNASFDIEMDDIYHVDNNVGAAYARRFRPLRITPEDVQDRWLDWAEADRMVTSRGEDGRVVKDEEGRVVKESSGDKNVHPDLYEYLIKNKEEIYDYSGVKNAYRDSGFDKGSAVLTPSPNYRTWDMLSKYVYTSIRNGSHPGLVRETVEGLIGKKHAEKLMEYLSDKGYFWLKVEMSEDVEDPAEYRDEIDAFLENSLDSDIPALIVGPSSLGKTARVSEYARNRGAELIVITLSALERIDLLGLPTKVNTDAFIAKELDVKPKMKDVGKMMKDIMKEVKEQTDEDGNKVFHVPEKLTTKAPDADMKRKFKDCVDRGIPVVMFFDECNRVTNRAVMSAMFEAISDCFVGDTRIRLLDGSVKTMRELHEEYGDSGEGFWVYSSTEDGKVVPGYAHSPRVVSGESKKLVKVTLDNGKSEICTDYHLWMKRDGEYCRADELEEGTSLMPLYTRISDKEDIIEGYEMVWDNASGSWVMTHRMVAESLGMVKKGKVIHHSDFNKGNNQPLNLDCSMSYKEHIKYHGSNLELMKECTDYEEKRLSGYNNWLENGGREFLREHALNNFNSEEANKRSSETRKARGRNSKEYRDRIAAGLIRFNRETAESGRKSDWMKEHHKKNPDIAVKFNKVGIEATRKNWKDQKFKSKMVEIHKLRCNNDEFKSVMRENAIKNNSNPEIKLKQQLGKVTKVVYKCLEKEGLVSEGIYESIRKEYFGKGYPGYEKATLTVKEIGMDRVEDVAVNYNHKVVCVEVLDYKEDVYDITVDEHHNFALDSGVFVHNSRIFGIDFDPKLVKIVGAGNYGENYRTKELDPALVGRFSTYYKPRYDEKDVYSFLRYLERKNDPKKNSNEMFIEYLKSKIDKDGVGSVVRILEQVENESVEEGVPTTRAFNQASRDLSSMSNSRMFSGKLVFNTLEKENILVDYKEKVGYDVDDDEIFDFLKEKVPRLTSGINSWAGVKANESVELANGQVMSAKEMADALKEIERELLADKDAYMALSIDERASIKQFVLTLMVNINAIDSRNKGLRLDTFYSYFGPEFSNDFAPYFNSKFGERTGRITIAMLDDIENIPIYIDQEYGGFSGSVEDWVEMAKKDIEEFYKEHESRLPSGHYFSYMSGIIESSYSVEALSRLMGGAIPGGPIDRVVKLAEGGDVDRIVNIVRKVSGISVSKDSVKEVEGKVKRGLSGRKKSRLL